MAKKAKTETTTESPAPTNGGPQTVEDFLNSIYTDPHNPERSIRIGDLPVKSIARVFTKGANEILTDSGAFSKEQVEKFTAEGVLDAKRAEARDKRWNSLITGEFSVGVRGPRGDEVERETRKILMAELEAYYNSLRGTNPKLANVSWSAVKAEQRDVLLAKWTGAIDKATGRTKGELAREKAQANVADRKAAAESVEGMDLAI